ncbi:cytochrome c oxidase assembly protein [Motiliproteus sediminis]|uniref:cytochrome c oxidase assembly protein n=1 Tax=Motiliproteus sediminis TaxID=1468178 RepID=UPI001AEFB8C2|nr:cytochrome c oxidase assembly protein [Motiliproteus sediminis]
MSATTANRRLALRLALAAVLMFGFGFLLSPLYDVFCRVTGINGKVTRTGAVTEAVQVDAARQVRVQLIAVNNEGMPWGFRPEQHQLSVHPGEQTLIHYVAHNPTAVEMVARAVPSVAPAEAASYVQKVNCFCFEAQTLAGSASQRMPLVLMIDPQLPAHIETITLSYTLFDITADQVGHQSAPQQPSARRVSL